MTAPEPTLEHLATQLREAHARVWTRTGERQPESTEEDYRAWLRASERYEDVLARKREGR